MPVETALSFTTCSPPSIHRSNNHHLHPHPRAVCEPSGLSHRGHCPCGESTESPGRCKNRLAPTPEKQCSMSYFLLKTRTTMIPTASQTPALCPEGFPSHAELRLHDLLQLPGSFIKITVLTQPHWARATPSPYPNKCKMSMLEKSWKPLKISLPFSEK